MQTKPFLSSTEIKAIAAAAEAEALKNGWNVSIAIVDDGGHLLHFQRLDGATPMTVEMSQAKARVAALGRKESKRYEDIINEGRFSFLSAPLQYGLLEGAVPVIVQGHCIGAVGVSGVQSSDDARIAQAGIAALGNLGA